MSIKKQELIDGCFAKAADDEPLFVLRGQDKLAPGIVRFWAMQYRQQHLLNETAGIAWVEKYGEAMRLADAMEQWPTRKMPD